MKRINGFIGTALLTAAVICLGGCSFGGRTNYEYANGDKYTAGDRDITDRIEKIDINYMSGDVKLTGSTSDQVTIRETSLRQLDEKQKVHTWVDGSTLYVRYCASAKNLDLFDLKKNLEITVPSSVRLSDLKTDMSSGDIAFYGIETGNFDVSASSGNVAADIASDSVNIGTNSGNIELTLEKDCGTVSLSASSGDILAAVKNADKMDASASSGSINIRAESIRDLKTNNSSGDQNLYFEREPEAADISASSGDVTCNLPGDADLAATLEVSSGKVTYDLPLSKSGDDIYVCGNGTNRLKIQTSSGDIRLLKN
ncbi:MAG: DUF4097 domain-containing protein [Lachnospiraceae bacterium]|nr:DUF4097 domain-containing protein [Lachnospiraceae bacterium]